jgi:two-component system sensor histidine kinase QseC
VPTLAGVSAGFHDAELSQHAWRLFLLHDRADDLWILVGERADVRGELAAKIALRSLVPDLLGLPLVALLVWLAVGWGLSPLESMVRLLKSRAPDSLSPLVVGPVPIELEAMVASINRLMVQANELLARERRFLAYAAHELRTPLTVLRIQAHNAAHAPDVADRGVALKQLDSSVLRATRVVEQLLTLARLEPGAAELDLQPINMLVRVREQLAELTLLALGRQQELTLEASGQDDWQLLVDAHCLDVLLQNLVSNAVQHTPEGGQVVVCLQAEPDAVTLCVQDSGPGVPAEQRSQVFEPFFRQGPAQGAGLGLAIVARIVELHAARITLGDSPQGGLQVCVRWPRGRTVAP